MRSVIEGVTFALNDSLEIMRDLGIRVNRIRATGGGARSDLWRQIQSDVFGATLETTESEGPALGAAILAGVGVGVFPTVEAGVEQAVAVTGETSPDPEIQGLYARLQEFYDSLYPALTGRFAALTRLE